jgi:hypothetical protein
MPKKVAAKRKKDDSALVPRNQETALALPKANAEMTVEALEAYQRLQVDLDQAMPGALIKIQGTPYRKKQYWRAVKTGFHISCEKQDEERFECPNREIWPGQCDWGWAMTYRAIHESGVHEDGDGTSTASEKLIYRSNWINRKKVFERDEYGNKIVDIDASMQNATDHNIRAHATTRAKNRAISDLVAFGEVSAEELVFSDHSDGGENTPEPEDRPEREINPAKADQGAKTEPREQAPRPRASQPGNHRSSSQETGEAATPKQGTMLFAVSCSQAREMDLSAYEDEMELATMIRDAACEEVGVQDRKVIMKSEVQPLKEAMLRAAQSPHDGTIWIRPEEQEPAGQEPQTF